MFIKKAAPLFLGKLIGSWSHFQTAVPIFKFYVNIPYVAIIFNDNWHMRCSVVEAYENNTWNIEHHNIIILCQLLSYIVFCFLTIC